MAVSGSRDFIHTRNTYIQAALRKLGIGQQITDVARIAEAAEALNTMILSWQARNIYLWTVESDIQVLTADQESYTLDSDIVGVLPEGMFIRRNGTDTPIRVITREEFDNYPTKSQSAASPNFCYIEHTLAALKLFFLPRASVTTIIANGTDGNSYLCIQDHTADADNKPITGADYATYWVQTTEAENTVWALDGEYKSPAVYYRKILRLQDFDAVGDNPDFPVWASKAIIYGLAYDLAPEYSVSTADRDRLKIDFEVEFEIVRNMTTESTKSLQFAPDRSL